MAEAHRLSTAMSHLPLPLAQTLRRAINAKSPSEQHNGAYYFFESTLKLAAAAQIGVYLATDHTSARINEMIEALTRPSTGHWLGLLRETAGVLAQRTDAALLPLAGVHERLTARFELPAAAAFLKFAAQSSGGTESRQKLRALDLLDGVVAYRNAELGHGAQRERAFYAEAAPLLVDAVLELIETAKPFAGLQLAVARDVLDTSSQRAERKYEVLRGDGLHLPMEGTHEDDARIPAGRLVLGAGKVRVQLHPLVVYEVDRMDRDRVGFLNKVATRGRGDTALIKGVEYLDYDSGERLEAHDAIEELAGLLSRVRGAKVSADSVAQMTSAETRVESGAVAPQSGQWIGDFELISELGRGGMGIVYEALQGSLKRHVALKVLPPGIAGDPIAVARFKREIAALGRCDHPNVVKVLTAGKEGDRHYYAMEYVEGSDLGQVFGVLSDWRMQTQGDLLEGHLRQAISSVVSSRGDKNQPVANDNIALPRKQPDAPALTGGRDYYSRIAEILADAARGVDHLHSHGIIHRDLKPGNIMLTSDSRRAVIMDLGLAQMQDRSLSLTASSVKILGTLRYMPPEQLQHNLLEVTPKADIYSLGATLYELAVLSPIFDGDSEAKLIAQVLQQEPRPPRSVNGRVPRDLETIITVATAKNPAERYATAAHLADDLQRFAKGEPITARPPSTFHYLKLFYRKNRALVLTVAAALLILVGVVAVFMQQLASALATAEQQRQIAVDAGVETKQALGLSESERRRAEQAARAEGEARQLAADNYQRAMESDRTARSALADANRNLVLVHEEKALRAEAGHRLHDALAHRLEAARLAVEADAPTLAAKLRDLAAATDQRTPMRLWGTQPEPFDGMAWDLLIDEKCVGGVRIERLVSGTATAWLYDIRTGAAVFSIPLSEPPIKAELSPGAEFLACVYAQRGIQVFDLRKGAPAVPVAFDPRESARSLNDLGFSADGKWLVLATDNHEVRYHDPATGRLDRTVKIPAGLQISRLDAQAGVVIAESEAEKNTGVFDAATGEQLVRLPSLSWGSSVSADRRYLLERRYPPKRSLLWDLSRSPPESREIETPLSSPSFSPDSKQVVGWADGALLLLDVASGKTLWQSPEKWLGYQPPRFHPNGKHLLVGSTRMGVFVLDRATGKPLSRPWGHSAALVGASVSPDGSLLATAGFDVRLLVWDACSGDLLRELERPWGRVEPAWTPDSQILYVAAQHGIRSYSVGADFAQGLLVPDGVAAPQCRAIRVSADGRHVFGLFSQGQQQDRTVVTCWDCDSGQLVKQAQFDFVPLDMGLRTTRSATGPAHLLLTILDREQRVHLLDGLSLAELETRQVEAQAEVSYLSRDGLHLATCHSAHGLWLYALAPPAGQSPDGKKYTQHRILPPFEAGSDDGAHPYFSPDGRTLYVSDARGQVSSCSLDEKTPVPRLWFPRATTAIGATADGRLLYTTGSRGELECWAMPLDHTPSRLAETKDLPVDIVAAGRSSIYYSTDKGAGVVHADAFTGEVIRSLKLEEASGPASLIGLAISPNGSWLAAGGGDEGETSACRVRVWDLATGELHRLLELEPNVVCLSTRFSADGSLLYACTTADGSGATLGRVHVFRTSDWAPLDGLQLADAGVISLDLGPDGTRLVTLDTKRRLIAWDLATSARLGQVTVQFRSDIAFPLWNAFDGLVYLPNTAKGVSAWDPIAGKLAAELPPAGWDFMRVRPLRGGRHVVAGGMGNQLVVWDCQTREIVRTLDLPAGERAAIGLATTPENVLYAGLTRQIIRLDLGLEKPVSPLAGLTSGQLAAWIPQRTQRQIDGLELIPWQASNRAILWVGPHDDWAAQSPTWLQPPAPDLRPDRLWARDQHGAEAQRISADRKARMAESWQRQFEGFRYRLEKQPDGTTTRVPVPRREMDTQGRYIGQPAGRIDYVAWYKAHIGDLPIALPPKPPDNSGPSD